MRAFWSGGYEATSTQDLCEATGLGRSSIYNTFVSKHELFDKALCRYMEYKGGLLGELLASDLPARQKIRRLLWQAVETPAGDPVGCLAVNSAVELAPRDPEVAARLRRDREWRLEALRGLIDAGKRDGEIKAAKDTRTLAHFVMATMSGMCVAARGGADRTVLEQIATTALDAI